MIAIILHIYHTELWEYFEEKLKPLHTKFDLYVTLCDEVEDITDKILKTFPNADVKKYQNKGQDIGPFLLTLKNIRNDNYDFLIKLHTKKRPLNPKFGTHWRNQLVNSLIASDEILTENIRILSEGDYKMCGCKRWHLGRNNRSSNWMNKKHQEFIAGTMFMADFKLMIELLSDQTIDEWYSRMPEGYHRDRTFTHNIERTLGQIIIDAGFKIKSV